MHSFQVMHTHTHKQMDKCMRIQYPYPFPNVGQGLISKWRFHYFQPSNDDKLWSFYFFTSFFFDHNCSSSDILKGYLINDREHENIMCIRWSFVSQFFCNNRPIWMGYQVPLEQ